MQVLRVIGDERSQSSAGLGVVAGSVIKHGAEFVEPKGDTDVFGGQHDAAHSVFDRGLGDPHVRRTEVNRRGSS
jgi:hypothetical protein